MSQRFKDFQDKFAAIEEEKEEIKRHEEEMEQKRKMNELERSIALLNEFQDIYSGVWNGAKYDYATDFLEEHGDELAPEFKQYIAGIKDYEYFKSESPDYTYSWSAVEAEQEGKALKQQLDLSADEHLGNVLEQFRVDMGLAGDVDIAAILANSKDAQEIFKMWNNPPTVLPQPEPAEYEAVYSYSDDDNFFYNVGNYILDQANNMFIFEQPVMSFIDGIKNSFIEWTQFGNLEQNSNPFISFIGGAATAIVSVPFDLLEIGYTSERMKYDFAAMFAYQIGGITAFDPYGMQQYLSQIPTYAGLTQLAEFAKENPSAFIGEITGQIIGWGALLGGIDVYTKPPNYQYSAPEGFEIEVPNQENIPFEITPLKQFGIDLRSPAEAYRYFQDIVKNLEEQRYTITKDESQLFDQFGNPVEAKADPATGELIYGSKTRLMAFFHEIKHLFQEPPKQMYDAQWYLNELEALKYELKIAEMTGALNDRELIALKREITRTKIKYELAKYGGDS
jgi:hypothetical protein